MNPPWGNMLVWRTDEYLRNKSDVNSEILLRQLQELTAHQDSITFKHVHDESNKLCLCLHQLICNLDSSSDVLWASLGVLEKCFSNVSAYSSLIPGDKFIAPISELLLRNLSHERKICVLKILLELTKEIKILEKESSLQSLTSNLTEFIMTGEADIVRLSLIILVNVCRNNSSVVYNIKGCIGGNFLRAVMNLQDDSITTKMQMCKLLFLLEPISLAVDGPPDISRTIIDITFSNLIEAYEKREVLLLNDIVDFFRELTFLPNYVDLLRASDKYSDYSQNILHLIEKSNSETADAIFGFVHSLLSVKIPALVPIYPQTMELSLQRLENLEIGKNYSKVLRVLIVLVSDVKKDTAVCYDVIQLLDRYLHSILQLYHCTKLPMNEVCLVAILQLLQKILKFEELRTKLIQGISKQRMEEIFHIFGVLTHYEQPQCYQNYIMLCVSALTFLLNLSQYDGSYCQLCDKMLSSSEILKIVAAGFYDNLARTEVLTLISSMKHISEDSLSILAKILSGNYSSCVPAEEITENVSVSQSFLHSSSFYLKEGCQVDELVKATKEKLDNRELKNITVSTVMSLFEYKVSAASHTEQNLYCNLEIVSRHCTEMQQKLVETETCVQQMRELLLKNQQCAEYLSAELMELDHIKEVDRINCRKNMRKYREESLAKEKLFHEKQLEHEHLKTETQSLCDSKRNLDIHLGLALEKIVSTSYTLNKHSVQFHDLEERQKESNSVYSELREKSKFLVESLNRRKNLHVQLDAEAAGLKKENTTLEKDIANLQMLSTAQKKTAQEKDQELQNMKQQLSELQHMRELIANISSVRKIK